MKELIFEYTFNDEWLFEAYLSYDKNPIDFVVEETKAKFEDKIEAQAVGSSTIHFEVSEGEIENLFSYIKEIICAKYNVADFNKIGTSIQYKKGEKTVNESENSSSPVEDGEMNLDEKLLEIENTLKTMFDRNSSDTDDDDIEDTKDEIIDLVGAKGYKDLIEEIKLIAPIIKKNKTEKAFIRQSYLFSINDGDGLSTYLNDFAKNLVELGLSPAKRPTVLEDKVESSAKDKDLNAYSFFSGNPCISCIDISECMTSLETSHFKKFLREIAECAKNTVVVFKVPFLEKDVLKNISLSINDLMFVRTVSVLPFSMEELKTCAVNELKKYDFTLADDAWQLFEQRIMDEKSDGKFYGIKTVKKVVNEIIYKKQLACAKGISEGFVITKNDLDGLSSEFIDSGKSGMELLNELVGSEKIVEKVKEIIAQINLSKNSKDLDAPCVHMRFVGSPGTGKTTVARIIGKILKENGVLRVGSFFEYSGRDFVGRFIGETAPKVSGMCRDAYGSVLFIDEAYSLYRAHDDNNKDFGREALDTLIAEMENHRSDMLVIMAGYTDEMEKLMLGNSGLASRMPYTLEFPNFTREQLYEIFCLMVKKKFKYDDELLPCAKDYFLGLSDNVIGAKDFANARFVRNLFERTWGKASSRMQFTNQEEIVLTKDDFVRATSEKEFNVSKKKREIGFH